MIVLFLVILSEANSITNCSLRDCGTKSSSNFCRRLNTMRHRCTPNTEIEYCEYGRPELGLLEAVPSLDHCS
ncbi:hypothetical protein TNCV_448811 [Trichonephila clavipes]|nr:hypothetical protein TNCV_448811 [Trichonephila clavipes]